jgi:hypothetical protein
MDTLIMLESIADLILGMFLLFAVLKVIKANMKED